MDADNVVVWSQQSKKKIQARMPERNGTLISNQAPNSSAEVKVTKSLILAFKEEEYALYK
jgi:hypothetical protein